MSGGDPFRAYYREVAAANRRRAIHRVIGCALMILSALVVCVFLWTLMVYVLSGGEWNP